MALLENLSDDELRSKLAEYGHPVGPITETTRKILVKRLQKLANEKKPSRRSVFSFSSADESGSEEHGGVGRQRRVPVSPPVSLMSRKKSVSSRNNSLNSSTNSDFIAPSVSMAPSRRRSSTRNRSRLSAFDYDSGSDSDFNISSAPSSSKILSSHRRSLPSRISRSPISSNSTLNTRKDNKPFLSNITRRLARWGNELNPQDIKETDVDDGTSCVAATSFSYRGSPSVARTLHDRQPVLDIQWKTHLIEKGPMLLLSLFVLFFLWVAATYCLRVYQQRPLLTGKTNNVYPLCTEQDPVRCIPSAELPLTVALYKDVHQVLLSRAVQSICGPTSEDGSYVQPFLTEREIVQLLIKARPSDVGRIERSVRNLGLLLLANPHWGIAVLRGDAEPPVTATSKIEDSSRAVPSDLEGGMPLHFMTPGPEVSWGCRLRLIFFGLSFYLGATIFILGLGYAVVSTAKYYLHAIKEEEEQVLRLVERILSEVTEGCARNQQEFVAIRHVHDTLIAPAQRPRMAAIWQKAVQFIEKNESRIRREIQTVWGEETEVWRPLMPTSPTSANNPPSPDNHLYPDLSSVVQKEGQRVWQGEAFETSDGSINALPTSPTPCLKIRHMFQANKNYGADWEVAVRDAIIEKCEGVGIVHLAVDTHSNEGCVFLKCTSSADAGLAFRRLHGSWFDGALVTVKYLRLERYRERFPESANCTVPLKPSNNLRLSMGGRA